MRAASSFVNWSSTERSMPVATKKLIDDLVCSGFVERLESQGVLCEGEGLHLDELVIVTIMEAPLQILWLMSLVLVMIYEDVFGPNNNEVRIIEQRKSITVAQTELRVSKYDISLTKPPEPPTVRLHPR